MNKVEKTINELISYFNGKKTTIGAILLFIAAMPHMGEYTGQSAIDIIQYIGLAFTGVGVMHKGVKKATKKEA